MLLGVPQRKFGRGYSLNQPGACGARQNLLGDTGLSTKREARSKEAVQAPTRLHEDICMRYFHNSRQLGNLDNVFGTRGRQVSTPLSQRPRETALFVTARTQEVRTVWGSLYRLAFWRPAPQKKSGSKWHVGCKGRRRRGGLGLGQACGEGGLRQLSLSKCKSVDPGEGDWGWESHGMQA